MTPPKKPSAQVVAQYLAAGDYDAEIEPIYDALTARFASGDIGTKWRIDYEDLSISEDDLTLGEAFLIEQVAGTNWININPSLSAKDCRAILQVCVKERQGLTIEEAQAKVDALTVAGLSKAIKVEVQSPAPLDAAP